ncbi:MAG: hypothetical protein JNL33_14400 [Betaproteobacteria bacterium]|nr:hypothetical protein [Betaproteobacteria bacterium]
MTVAAEAGESTNARRATGRRIRGAMLLLALATVPGVRADPAAGTCAIGTLTHRAAQATCEIGQAGEARRLRVEILVSGVHDDSQAVLSVALDGTPIRCAAGDRTLISGPDGDEGDLVLVCRFTAQAAPGKVTADLSINHVQVDEVRLLPDLPPAR